MGILFVYNNLKVKLMSKSPDFPYTPGEGYKHFQSGPVSLAVFSCLSTDGLLRIVGRLAGL